MSRSLHCLTPNTNEPTKRLGTSHMHYVAMHTTSDPRRWWAPVAGGARVNHTHQQSSDQVAAKPTHVRSVAIHTIERSGRWRFVPKTGSRVGRGIDTEGPELRASSHHLGSEPRSMLQGQLRPRRATKPNQLGFLKCESGGWKPWLEAPRPTTPNNTMY
jgi:hypothetical protein